MRKLINGARNTMKIVGVERATSVEFDESNNLAKINFCDLRFYHLCLELGCVFCLKEESIKDGERLKWSNFDNNGLITRLRDNHGFSSIV